MSCARQQFAEGAVDGVVIASGNRLARGDDVVERPFQLGQKEPERLANPSFDKTAHDAVTDLFADGNTDLGVVCFDESDDEDGANKGFSVAADVGKAGAVGQTERALHGKTIMPSGWLCLFCDGGTERVCRFWCSFFDGNRGLCFFVFFWVGKFFSYLTPL